MDECGRESGEAMKDIGDARSHRKITVSAVPQYHVSKLFWKDFSNNGTFVFLIKGQIQIVL